MCVRRGAQVSECPHCQQKMAPIGLPCEHPRQATSWASDEPHAVQNLPPAAWVPHDGQRVDD